MLLEIQFEIRDRFDQHSRELGILMWKYGIFSGEISDNVHRPLAASFGVRFRAGLEFALRTSPFPYEAYSYQRLNANRVRRVRQVADVCKPAEIHHQARTMEGPEKPTGELARRAARPRDAHHQGAAAARSTVST
jgi:hypothetical protein